MEKIYNPTKLFDLPISFDWRAHGAVTPVKSQGYCGACYAFSATGSMEGQVFRKTGKLLSLSEQQIIDCNQTDNGCNGGFIRRAFTYINMNDGIEMEEAYPFVSGNSAIAYKCVFNKNKVAAINMGYTVVKNNSQHIQTALVNMGPLSAGIYAGYSLKNYHSGVLTADKCYSNTMLNHAVLIVGYGVDERTKLPYWLVKNSWGVDANDKGYFKIQRGVNACGIESDISFPLV